MQLAKSLCPRALAALLQATRAIQKMQGNVVPTDAEDRHDPEQHDEELVKVQVLWSYMSGLCFTHNRSNFVLSTDSKKRYALMQDTAAELLRNISLLLVMMLSDNAKPVLDDMQSTAVILHDNALLVTKSNALKQTGIVPAGLSVIYALDHRYTGSLCIYPLISCA